MLQGTYFLLVESVPSNRLVATVGTFRGSALQIIFLPPKILLCPEKFILEHITKTTSSPLKMYSAPSNLKIWLCLAGKYRKAIVSNFNYTVFG